MGRQLIWQEIESIRDRAKHGADGGFESAEFARVVCIRDVPRLLEEIAALRAENAAFKADIEAGRLVKLKHEPHTFVSFLDGGNQIREHYRYMSSYLQDGRPVHIVYHGSKPYEHCLAADDEICEDTPAARAALEGGQQ